MRSSAELAHGLWPAEPGSELGIAKQKNLHTYGPGRSPGGPRAKRGEWRASARSELRPDDRGHDCSRNTGLPILRSLWSASVHRDRKPSKRLQQNHGDERHDDR